MAIFSTSVRAQTCSDVVNGVCDASFERRFGLKLGTIAASQESRQVVDSADDVIDKSSVPAITSSKESDSQKSLQREDGSLEVV